MCPGVTGSVSCVVSSAGNVPHPANVRTVYLLLLAIILKSLPSQIKQVAYVSNNYFGLFVYDTVINSSLTWLANWQVFEDRFSSFSFTCHHVSPNQYSMCISTLHVYMCVN